MSSQNEKPESFIEIIIFPEMPALMPGLWSSACFHFATKKYANGKNNTVDNNFSKHSCTRGYQR
jgi:hypothetical protein